ncbi:MAG: Bug family tripartite tricarboxylate transporter substrate binding protein [Burkholderiales bacterium]
MRIVLVASSTAFLSLSCLPAVAQDYPSRTIRIVVPTTPGGSSDTFARLIGERMRTRLGQAVIVDNRAGAGQLIGADMVAKSAPDGYTLVLPTPTLCGSAAIHPKAPFDAVNDLTGVARIGLGPFLAIVHPSVPVKNIKELIALAKSRPGQLNYGSSGAGSVLHFATEVFADEAGINIVHVPYKGAAPAVAATVSGEVPMIFMSLPSAWAQVKAKRLRAIAVTSPQRSKFVPDLPTVAESVPGYQAQQWWGLLAPAKVPAPIIDKLNAEINAILGTEEMRTQLANQGAEPVLMSPQQFTDFYRSEIERFKKVARERNIKAG